MKRKVIFTPDDYWTNPPRKNMNINPHNAGDLRRAGVLIKHRIAGDTDGVCPECATRPEPVNPPENSEYVRLVAFTRLLSNVAEALRLKGRTDAADTVHAEAVHFAGERDIARAVSDLDEDISAGTSEDLGPLTDD